MSRERDPLPASEAASRVWAAVEPTGETGMRGVDIRDAAQLTRSQFENGKAHLRDYRTIDEQKCFAYDGDVYVITRDAGRCARAMAIKMQSIDNQLIRLHKSVCAPISDDTDLDPGFRYLQRQLEAIMENLKILREAGYAARSNRIREASRQR